jgi:hypothetical protein
VRAARHFFDISLIFNRSQQFLYRAHPSQGLQPMRDLSIHVLSSRKRFEGDKCGTQNRADSGILFQESQALRLKQD